MEKVKTPSPRTLVKNGSNGGITPQVITMSVLLTGIAGAALMAINAKRLGEPYQGLKILLGMVILFGSIVYVSLMLPVDSRLPLILSQIPTALIIALYQRFQKEPYQLHKEGGGKKARTLPLVFSPVAIFLLCTVLYISFTPYYLRMMLSHPTLEEDGTIVVLDGASEEEGWHAMKGLKGYSAFSVLKKRAGAFSLAMHTGGNFLEKGPLRVLNFIAGEIYDQAGKLRPLEVEFVDLNRRVRIAAARYSYERRIPYGEHGGFIYYLGDATEKDALDFRISAAELLDGVHIEIWLIREGQELELFLRSGSQWTQEDLESLGESFRDIVEDLQWQQDYSVRLVLESANEETIQTDL